MSLALIQFSRKLGLLKWHRVSNALLLLVISVFPPAHALDPNSTITAYNTQSWYSDDGLPHNTVQGITQSNDGYLWFATWAGVARYNGRSFTTFNGENTKAFVNSGVRALVAGHDGVLWATTTNGGLMRYADGVWRQFGVDAGLPLTLYALFAQRNGKVLVGSQRDGLFIFDPSTEKATRMQNAEGTLDSWVQSIFEDDDGSIWIGTGRGLLLARGGTLQRFASGNGLVPGASIYAITRDRRGQLWVGGESGLYRMRKSDAGSAVPSQMVFNKVEFGEESAVQCLKQDKDGVLWIGTQSGGLVRFQNDTFDVLRAERGLANNRVMSLFEDREGSLWVGTNAGLTRLNDSAFVRLTRRDGLSDEFIRTIYPARGGGMWVGTSRGLNLVENGTAASAAFPGLADVSITSVIEDSSGQVWVGSYDRGLFARETNRSAWRHLTRATGELPHNQVRALIAAKDGAVWVGTAQGAIRMLGKDVRRFTTEQGLPRDYVLSFMQSQDGRIWIGTGEGFMVWSDTDHTTYTAGKNYPARDAFGFYEDASGEVWIASNKGLLRFADGKFSALGLAQGLPDEVIFNVHEDRLGMFWLTSNLGLLRISRKSILQHLNNQAMALAVTTFGRADGMSAAQINGSTSPSVAIDSLGRMWLPTARGVTVVDPEALHTLRAGPVPTVIESFQVDRQTQSLIEPVKMDSGRHRLEFAFAGLSFLDAQRAEYRYRLAGYDRDWINAGSEPRAVFSDLRPGSYVFEVQGGTSANFGTSTRLAFEVLPRIWQRRWFWPSLIGLILALSGLGLRTFSKRHLVRQLELERMVAQRTLELSERNTALAKSDTEKSALLQTIQMQAEAFARQAREDALTGLPNRRFFDQRCAQVFNAARAANSLLVVALADIDYFKQVNDTYSHQLGDQVICAIAQTIAVNIQPVGLAARFGGEEFALFFHDPNIEFARLVCERIRADVAALRFADAEELRVTLSMGLTDAPNAENFERALMRADELMYQAKASGRNCVQTEPLSA